MRVGDVNAIEGSLVPSISILMHRSGGEDLEVEALMDSGFSGEFALPMSVVEDLGLEYAQGHIVVLADGSYHHVETFKGSVFFADEWHDVLVYSTGGGPAVGMRLLRGAKISFEAIPEGSIDWERIERPRPHWSRLRR